MSLSLSLSGRDWPEIGVRNQGKERENEESGTKHRMGLCVPSDDDDDEKRPFDRSSLDTVAGGGLDGTTPSSFSLSVFPSFVMYRVEKLNQAMHFLNQSFRFFDLPVQFGCSLCVR